MRFVLQPWHLIVLAVASIINREQQNVLDDLRVENRVLKDRLNSRGGRIRFTDRQRRLLASKELGRKILRRLDTIVTPDTLLRWYRQRIAKKYRAQTGRRRFGHREGGETRVEPAIPAGDAHNGALGGDNR